MLDDALFKEFDRTSMEDAEKALNFLQAKNIEALKMRSMSRHTSLSQMQHYLSRLELDISDIPVLHIAGSKGKGSTAAFTESILHQHGLRTGFFASPHLVSLRERFRVNTKSVDVDTFLKHFWFVFDKLYITRDQCDMYPPMPSYFSFLTLIAFSLYKSLDIDILVLEVGLGGKLDATNAVPAPYATAIVPLLLEHTEILGNSLTSIAREKAGIIKPNCPVVLTSQPAETLPVIFDTCIEHNTIPVFVQPLESNVVLGLHGAHQHGNASIACVLAALALDTIHKKKGKLPEPLSMDMDTLYEEIDGNLSPSQSIQLHQMFMDLEARQNQQDGQGYPSSYQDIVHAYHKYVASVQSKYGSLLQKTPVKTELYDSEKDNDTNPISPQITASTPVSANPKPYTLSRDFADYPSIPPLALPPLFLAGLARTSWAGRCQTVDVTSNLSFYLDGAHTADSVKLCTQWYQTKCQDGELGFLSSKHRRTSNTSLDTTTTNNINTTTTTTTTTPLTSPSLAFANSHSSTSSLSPSSSNSSSSSLASNTDYILLFNCGHVRSPYSLLTPLAQVHEVYPFTQVIFVPFDHDRLHVSTSASYAEIMKDYDGKFASKTIEEITMLTQAMQEQPEIRIPEYTDMDGVVHDVQSRLLRDYNWQITLGGIWNTITNSPHHPSYSLLSSITSSEPIPTPITTTTTPTGTSNTTNTSTTTTTTTTSIHPFMNLHSLDLSFGSKSIPDIPIPPISALSLSPPSSSPLSTATTSTTTTTTTSTTSSSSSSSSLASSLHRINTYKCHTTSDTVQTASPIDTNPILSMMGNAVVMSNTQDAVESIRRFAQSNPNRKVRTLVTGSLYLVGNVLKALKTPI